MRGIIYFIMVILLLSCVAAESMKTTELYETPANWCARLVITVSSTSTASSENYYIEDCAESAKNVWYCNCLSDEIFEVNFINRKSDVTPYIIDITSGDNTVRRVVSANAFIEVVTEEEKKDSLALKYQDEVNAITEGLSRVESKVNSLTALTDRNINEMKATIETRLTNIQAGNTIYQENKYDDSKIKEEFKAQIDEVKALMSPINSLSKGLTLRIVLISVIVNILILGVLLFIESKRVKQ